MFRVGIILKSGLVISKTVSTQTEALEFILKINTEQGVKRADVLNKKTGEREKIEI